MDEVSTQLTRALGICAFLVEGVSTHLHQRKQRGLSIILSRPWTFWKRRLRHGEAVKRRGRNDSGDHPLFPT